QGLAAWRASGAEIGLTHYLTPLIQAYKKAGHLREAESVLAEAFALVEKNAERFYEAELYRLKGELTLQKFNVHGSMFKATNPRSLTPDPQTEAEVCFLRAIDIARQQQAKSLELRATMSLVRLRQHQAAELGVRTTQHASRPTLDEAHQILFEIYHWFTEGFATKDLQEAKALLEELA
ncbi:MAG: hypothetical protein AB7P69_20075, partial [Candidatus Binatia bacterium]